MSLNKYGDDIAFGLLTLMILALVAAFVMVETKTNPCPRGEVGVINWNGTERCWAE